MHSTKTLDILSSRLHLLSVAETVDTIESWVHARGPCRQIVASGFHGIWECHRNAGLREKLASADLWVPDGILPVWIARSSGVRGATRAPGPDILTEFLRRARGRGDRSYFYGGEPELLATLCRRLSSEFPGHHIAGAYSPPFRSLSPSEEEAAVRRINESGADVLWVGLGTPKQDLWIAEHRNALKVPVAVGVGAAFAFAAGTIRRCPAWIGNAGLEWAYRLLQEPRKLWRRDLIDAPRFLLHLGMDLARTRVKTLRWS